MTLDYEDATRLRPRGLETGRTTKGARARQRIIEAATDLFAERGYHATSLSEIGDRAGIQRGALYYHIGAKEELLFEVVRQHVTFVLEHAQKIAAAPLDPRTKFRQLLVFQAESLLDRQREVTITARESQHLTQERLGEFTVLRESLEAIWHRVIQDGIDAGLIRPVDRVVVKAIIGLVVSPYGWFRPNQRLTSGEVAEYIADLVLYGVVAAPQARAEERRPIFATDFPN